MFGAHHSANTAARQSAALVEDTGDIALRLSWGPNDQRLPTSTQQFLLDKFSSLTDGASPQVINRTYVNIVFIDNDHDWKI